MTSSIQNSLLEALACDGDGFGVLNFNGGSFCTPLKPLTSCCLHMLQGMDKYGYRINVAYNTTYFILVYHKNAILTWS